MSGFLDGSHVHAGKESFLADLGVSIPAQLKREAARLQEAFAAFLDHTDAQIGRLVDGLRAIGELDRAAVGGDLVQRLGARADGPGELQAVRIRDMDGDGRADLFYVAKTTAGREVGFFRGRSRGGGYRGRGPWGRHGPSPSTRPWPHLRCRSPGPGW